MQATACVWIVQNRPFRRHAGHWAVSDPQSVKPSGKLIPVWNANTRLMEVGVGCETRWRREEGGSTVRIWDDSACPGSERLAA